MKSLHWLLQKLFIGCDFIPRSCCWCNLLKNEGLSLGLYILHFSVGMQISIISYVNKWVKVHSLVVHLTVFLNYEKNIELSFQFVCTRQILPWCTSVWFIPALFVCIVHQTRYKIETENYFQSKITGGAVMRVYAVVSRDRRDIYVCIPHMVYSVE